MRRAAYWLFPLIATAVAVFIVIFMIQINPAAPALNTGSDAGEKDASLHLNPEIGNWIERFSTSEEKGYFYPVNEVTLKLDTGGENSVLGMYRLTAPVKDANELSLVKKELNKSTLRYVIHEEGDAMTLSVDSTDQNKLVSLVTKLKTYQITATVSPYTEEK
jgi:hypothetical protein